MKNSIKQVAIETASAVEKSFLDLLEKKEKKKNLVVVGMNEGDDASDWDKVCQMAQSSGIEAPEIAIKTVFRDGAAGKRRPNGSIIPRILKVKFANQSYRERFLRGNYKRLGGDFSNLYVRRDLTYDERQRDRALKADLQERRSVENNPNLIIRNEKIVDRTELERGRGRSGNPPTSR
jgi:hypothetical protein